MVTIALPGAYGKPRPALVVQSDLFDEHPSVTILPITGELRATPLFRIDVRSSAANGLGKLIVDKAQSMPRDRLGDTIGRQRMNLVVGDPVTGRVSRHCLSGLSACRCTKYFCHGFCDVSS